MTTSPTVDQFEQTFRTWLKDPLVLGLTDAQIVLARPKGPGSSPRPPMPYLTIYIPQSTKLGEDWIETATSTPTLGVKASHAFTGAYDSTLRAHLAGVDGNNYTIALVPDSVGAVSVQVIGYTVLVHYRPGVSTVALVDAAITALSGTSDVVDVQTAGTGATVLDADDAVTAALTGGANATGASQAVRGEREVTISLQGFGAETAEWLDRLSLRVQRPDVVALCLAAGFGVRAEGPLRELTALLDTSFQPRYLRELTVGYQLYDAPDAAVEFETSETTITYDGALAEDPLIDIITTPAPA